MRLSNTTIVSLAAIALVTIVGGQFATGAKPLATATTVSTAGWVTNLDSALEIASRERRDVFVDFYSDTCPPCIELDKNTFPTEEAKSALAKYVTVKLKFDDATESTFLKYNVSVTPTLMVMNAKGEAQKSTVGYASPAELKSFLERNP